MPIAHVATEEGAPRRVALVEECTAVSIINEASTLECEAAGIRTLRPERDGHKDQYGEDTKNHDPQPPTR